jgi:hypothetical protein
MPLTDHKPTYLVRALTGFVVNLVTTSGRVASVVLTIGLFGLSSAAPCDVHASGIRSDASSDSIPDGYDEQQLLRCKEKATPVGKEGFLGVCDRSDGIEVTNTVIYDSTDQIALRSSLRSPQWKATARSLDKKAPFDLSGISSLEKLSGHYYRVDFQVTLPPDF